MRRPAKVREYIMRPHIPRGIVALLHGTTKIGKTWYVLQLALSICSGPTIPFFDGQAADKPLRVLYLSLEVDEDLVRERLASQFGWTDESLARFVLITEKLSLNPDNPKDWETLARLIRESGADLVIIDPLGRVSFGSRYDFNDFLTANKFVDVLARTIRPLNASAILVHHDRKGKGDEASDRLDMASGSKGLVNAADLVISLSTEPNRSRSSYARFVEITSRHSPIQETHCSFDHVDLCWRKYRPGDSDRKIPTQEEYEAWTKALSQDRLSTWRGRANP
jgi:RecA-family ATPase